MKFFFTCCFIGFIFVNSVFSQFESIGPYGGYIRCLVKDNQENILAGTANGGIFKTSDMGQNWSQIFYGHRNLDVRSLSVDVGSNYLAGTDGSGLFRSDNGGSTWTKLNNVLSTSTILSLLILPNGDILAGTFDGLFRSSDNGNSFTSTNGIAGAAVFSLGDGGSYLLAGTAYNGVFRSTDNGVNWQAVNNGIDFNNKTVESIAFGYSGNNPNAQPVPVATLGDILYEFDNGTATWTELPVPPKYLKSILITGDNTLIGAATSNINSSGGGVLYLPSGSGNWIEYTVPDCPFSSIVSTSAGLMAGSYGPGTYVTTNNSDWNLEVNKMSATAINGLDRTGGAITVATRHSGSFLSENEGQSFQNVNGNISWGWEYEFKLNPVTNKAWILHQDGAYKTNYGDWNNWTNTGHLANTMGFNSQGGTFLCSGNRVFITNDDINFQPVQVGNINQINSIAFDNNDIPYVATADENGFSGSGVWYSPNGGTAWTDITNNLPLNITTVKYVDLTGISESDCYKNIVAGSSDGKYFALNTDLTWNQLDLNFTSNSLIKDIASVNYGIGIEIGAVSENEMVCINSNCTPGDRFLFADQITNRLNYFMTAQKRGTANIIKLTGTLGSGILKQVSAAGINEEVSSLPEKYLLSQNYPNPFNPSTNISFELPKESYTTLEIYNALGEKVSTLVSKNLTAGSYKYEWDAKKFSSGIYFYRINTNEFNSTKKMMLLK